jgi:4-amino-4-deoxy-L-arabinose transferase-like glycosyltransferase
MCVFLYFIFLSYKNLGDKSKNAFLAGFAISLATLIRPNLGLVALAGGAIFLLLLIFLVLDNLYSSPHLILELL